MALHLEDGGSGVANVDGPLGDRTLSKATQRFYREAPHSAKASSHFDCNGRHAYLVERTLASQAYEHFESLLDVAVH